MRPQYTGMKVLHTLACGAGKRDREAVVSTILEFVVHPTRRHQGPPG